MKPRFHKVPVRLENSFSLRHAVNYKWRTGWHYHPELELHYVLQGEGVKLIGGSIQKFSAGEMILLGENLPHTWRCNEKGFGAIVLQFLPDCLGKDFLDLPEASSIPRLFEKAKEGLVITGEVRERLAFLLRQALEASDLDRLILLLSIFKILVANLDKVETVTSSYAFHRPVKMGIERLDKIYSYAMKNYKKEISLDEIASFANMSATSFCRYFKLMTNKTFFEFLNEIRISHACKALIESKLPTEVICFECGFNSVSNFYRHFKKITNVTPFEFRGKYLPK